MKPVIVCTDKRAVVFGYTKNAKKDPIKLKNARMALYWPKSVGGVFGLGEIGPNSETKVSAKLDSVSLVGVTAVFSVSRKAEETWNNAPVEGRN